MNFRRTLLVAFFVLSLASVLSIVSSAKRPAASVQGSQQKAVVFAVFGAGGALSATMEPILVIDGGQFKEPVSGGSDGDEITRFSNEHYSKGRKYRLLFGGAEAGSATVKKSN